MAKRKKIIKRKKVDEYLIYGIHGAIEVLESKRLKIVSVHIMKDGTASRRKEVLSILNKSRFNITTLQKEVFLKKYHGFRSQGIVVNFIGNIVKDVPSFKKLKGNICLLILSDIEDPQNIGQIIRTSECAGVNGIVIPKHGGSRITNAVLQVSQGAFMHMPIYETGNLGNLLIRLKDDGFWITGLENSIDEKYWFEIDYSGKTAIVVGSEGKGIRSGILKACDFKATIPMEGKTNSLNVSATVSAILFERQRQLALKSE